MNKMSPYANYLFKHRTNVMRGMDWMIENLNLGVDPDQLHRIAAEHDLSKYWPEEYSQYEAYFYPDPNQLNKEKVLVDFKQAWIHHIYHNPHHWQHWVLMNDEAADGVEALEIPLPYMIEMVADWWSFSWENGDLFEIFGWYAAHKDTMILHPKTREKVEALLAMLEAALSAGMGGYDADGD